ncbi:2-hydroxychromene-2-carboxylate isomerase [Stenotrophobium rhamnosiphilum]|uniref:2-hydroxychromene-2-carboxylate isomerase n=1 Tax=Stenotrophobium rhamnosiphilum TaxID=2029166 RepID=A0A2T5MC98_9GAMM|nr:2-hydroxychromene-2-carboxylate isomerase [Stenotrophobium rhamnosiphilum]PTU30208.1 disulfide bond formation protein DsbA [Stenotrophobium rhamnosiphilum]
MVGNNLKPQAKTIEFWFDFGSNYSYLTTMRIEQAASSLGVTVLWRPFLLGPIFKTFGWETSPFVLQKAKGEYVWKDMARECQKYGLAWKQPTNFPRASVLPLRVALSGADESWVAEFCRQVMTTNFVDDQDVDSTDVIRSILDRMGLPSEQILAAALSDKNKLALRHQTEAAQAKGIFGAPTFFVGYEMYWGNDRLDDALQYASSNNG